MPEPPDFDQIVERLALRTGAFQAPLAEIVAELAEQLRQVWNAALDAVDAKADECLGVGDEWTKRDIASVVKRLRAPSPAASDPPVAHPGNPPTRD